MINLNGILNPFAFINIGSFYLRYYAFIDAIIYLILFLGVAQIAFSKIYKDNKREAKIISVAIGISLTISMVILEMNTGFYLGQLEPVALIVFMIIIATLLYNMFQGLFEKKSVCGALTYLIIYGLLTVPFGSLNNWINTNAPFLAAVLVLGAVASLIFLIIEMFSMLGGSSPTTGKDGIPGKDGKDGISGKDGKDAVIPPTPPTSDPVKKGSPSVQIHEPHKTHNRKYKINEPIALVFRVFNVEKPFRYTIDVLSKNNGTDSTATIYAGIHGNDNVHVPNLKTVNPNFDFPSGYTYRIIVRIYDGNKNKLIDSDGKEVLDFTDIECINTVSNITPNASSANAPADSSSYDSYIDIKSPEKKNYESGKIIPIVFEAIGSEYTNGTKYYVRVFIKNLEGNKNADISGGDHTFTTSRGEIILPAIETLPEGNYELWVVTFKDKYLHKVKRVFGIYTKQKKSKTKKQEEKKIESLITQEQRIPEEKWLNKGQENKDFKPKIRIDGMRVSENLDGFRLKIDKDKHNLLLANMGEKKLFWIISYKNLTFRERLGNGTIHGTLSVGGYEQMTFNYTSGAKDASMIIKFMNEQGNEVSINPIKSR